MQSPCSPWGPLRSGWLLLGHSFKQNQTNAIRSLKIEKNSSITTEQQTNQNEYSFLTSVIVLPCSWTAFWHGGTGSSCPVKQGILVASNERECQCIWLVRLELCWTFLVLRFLLSSLALMKPFKRLPGSNGQPNRGSLWRRTKESVSVPDSSDLNCAELFSFCNFCFHPAHGWNVFREPQDAFQIWFWTSPYPPWLPRDRLLSATAQQNWQPWLKWRKECAAMRQAKLKRCFLFRAQHTGRRDWINWTPVLDRE